MICIEPFGMDCIIFQCDVCREERISITNTTDYPQGMARRSARKSGWALQREADFAVCPGCIKKFTSFDMPHHKPFPEPS